VNASSVVNPLISASELLGALEGGSPLVLVDARFWLGQHGRGRAAYEAGHIPGARFVDVDEELAEPARGDGIRPGTSARGRHPRPSAERLAGAVGRLGINNDSSVVVYDQGTSLAAAWFRWLLRDAGQLNIRVLDGGFAAWQAAGGAVSTDDADGTGSFVPQPGQLPALTVDEVPGFLAAGHQLVDVRAAERFRGETEPVDPIAGHIPGASNLPASTLQQADGPSCPPPSCASTWRVSRPGTPSAVAPGSPHPRPCWPPSRQESTAWRSTPVRGRSGSPTPPARLLSVAACRLAAARTGAEGHRCVSSAGAPHPDSE